MATNKEVFKDKKVIQVIDSYTQETKIFCGCQESHEPTGVITMQDPKEELPFWMDERQKSFINPSNAPYAKELNECPLCGQRSSVLVYAANGYGGTENCDYVNTYDNGHLISLSIGESIYTYIGKQNRIFYNQRRSRYTFNATTGMTYFIQKGKIRNVTLPAERQERLYNQARLKSPEALEFFEQLCIERRGLQYVDMDKLKLRRNHLQAYDNNIDALRLVLRYPVLQNLPLYEVYLPHKKDRQFLLSNPSLTELFRYFTGHGTKPLRKLVGNDAKMFAHACQLGYVFDQPDYVTNILKNIRKEDAGLYSFRYNNHSEIIPVNSSEHPLQSVKRDFEEFRDTFCYGDMNLFVKRFLGVTEPSRSPLQAAASPSLPWLEVEGVHYEIKQLFSLNSAQRYICDSMNMYRQIMAQAPNFSLKLETTIKALHDQLAVIHSRIRTKNSLIPLREYQNDFDQTIGNVEFRRAESTHRLVDIGKKMNLCVGAYGPQVLQGHCTIVQAYVDGKYALCLEVDSMNQLSQAKSNYNYMPNQELFDATKLWAKNANVGLKDCYDMDPTRILDADTASLLTEADTVENIINVDELNEEQLQAIIDTPLTPGHYHDEQVLMQPMQPQGYHQAPAPMQHQQPLAYVQPPAAMYQAAPGQPQMAPVQVYHAQAAPVQQVAEPVEGYREEGNDDLPF